MLPNEVIHPIIHNYRKFIEEFCGVFLRQIELENQALQACRASVNPISTKGGRLCPPNNTGTPGFSDLPMALHCELYDGLPH